MWSVGAWISLNEISISKEPNDRTFNICYEQQSGDGMVFYRDSSVSSNELLYALWNGTTWSDDNIMLDIIGGLTSIDCKSDKTSDYIAITTKDNDDDIWLIIWNGTAIVNSTEVEDHSFNVDGQRVLGDWDYEGGYFLTAWYADVDHAIDGWKYTKSSNDVLRWMILLVVLVLELGKITILLWLQVQILKKLY